MEAQEITIDQPFHGAYEKFLEITTHLSGEAFGETTPSAIEAYLETDGRELLRLKLLRVFRRADASRMGQGLGQQRHTKAVRSEKCVVLRRRTWDGTASDRHVFWLAYS